MSVILPFNILNGTVANADQVMANFNALNTTQTTIIDINNYGVIGDGVTDDTAALETAIAAGVSQGLPVFIPPGNYKLTSKISIPDKLIMYGYWNFSIGTNAFYNTNFWGDHTDTVFEMSTTGKGVYLSGFAVRKRSVYDGTGIGIKFYTDTAGGVNDNWRLNNVAILNVATGLHIEDAIFSVIERVAIIDTATAILLSNPEYPTGNHDLLFSNLWLSGFDYGIKMVGNTKLIKFDRVKMFYGATRNIYADDTGTKHNNTFFGIYFEASTITSLEGLIELLNGTSWVFDRIHISENNHPLFHTTTPDSVAMEISVSNVVDIGNMAGNLGKGYIEAKNSGALDSLRHSFRGRLSDEVENSTGSFSMLSRRAIKGFSVFCQEMITSALQCGIKNTNYLITPNIAGGSWSRTDTIVTTGQGDPYGGTKAFRITGSPTDATVASLFKGNIAVDTTSLANRTFTFQTWAKAATVTTQTYFSLMFGTASGGNNYVDTTVNLDRPGWNPIWATYKVANTDTATTLLVYIFTKDCYVYEPCIYFSDKPSVFTDHSDGIPSGTYFERRWGVYTQRDASYLEPVATPSVLANTSWMTSGSTTITNFTSGTSGQVITVMANSNVTITNGTNIFLQGNSNFLMSSPDILTLVYKNDSKWYEVSRSDNT